MCTNQGGGQQAIPHRDQRVHIAVKLHSKHITLSSSYPHSRSLALYLISPNPVKQDRQG